LNWVLEDINFRVEKGQAVGIIGINGAGKSTLLKMITGTTRPTEGSVSVNGRVSALLELGMGFHPDFTGRQNVYMAGQLLGLSVGEITALMPDIEAFADVGEYFDQPVRIYSSGMQARVAFSAATAVKPDILIVDEALSVGDIAFQSKCMQRMQNLLDHGTTTLFVSHALNQVRQFCKKALYLAHGTGKAWGKADEICDLYQNDLSGISEISQEKNQTKIHRYNDKLSFRRNPLLRKNSVDGEAGGTLELEYLDFQVLNENNNPVVSCRSGDLLKFQAIIQANENIPEGAMLGILIADKSGYHLMACNTSYYDKFIPELKKGEIVLIECSFEIPFAAGEFRIDTGMKPETFSSIFYDRVFCAAVLSVVPNTSLLKRNFGGYLYAKDAEINITVYGKQE
jgi:lipopolysaccharide transport system ATP-binding protein